MARKRNPKVEKFPPLEQGAAPATDLLSGGGPGVEVLSIPEIDKAINKYERKKEARCSASPDEIAAKNDLKGLLHKNREKLPLNEDGEHFYRLEGVDYVLEESLRRRKVDDGGDED